MAGSLVAVWVREEPRLRPVITVAESLVAVWDLEESRLPPGLTMESTGFESSRIRTKDLDVDTTAFHLLQFILNTKLSG